MFSFCKIQPERLKRPKPCGYSLGVDRFERFRFSVLAVPLRKRFVCPSVKFKTEGRVQFWFLFPGSGSGSSSSLSAPDKGLVLVSLSGSVLAQPCKKGACGRLSKTSQRWWFGGEGAILERGEKTPIPKISALLRKQPVLLRAHFILTKDRKRPYYGHFCCKIHREGSCSKAAGGP